MYAETTPPVHPVLKAVHHQGLTLENVEYSMCRTRRCCEPNNALLYLFVPWQLWTLFRQLGAMTPAYLSLFWHEAPR